jgi:hypothetical protein
VFSWLRSQHGFASYFAKDMGTYGAILNEHLPESYLKKIMTTRHRMMIVLGTLAALAVAVWDWWLLFILFK